MSAVSRTLLVALGLSVLTPVALARQSPTDSPPTGTRSGTTGTSTGTRSDAAQQSDPEHGMGMHGQHEHDMAGMQHEHPAHSMADQATLWKRLDTDHDGRISNAEVNADPDLGARFVLIDANRDGYLTAAEYQTYERAGMGAGTAGTMGEDMSGTGMMQDDSGSGWTDADASGWSDDAASTGAAATGKDAKARPAKPTKSNTKDKDDRSDSARDDH